MIKVNLVRNQTTRARLRISAPTVSGIGLALLALFSILLAGLGGWWYSINRDIGRLSESRDELRAENLRLQAVLIQINEYEKLKKLQESRIKVIEKLQEAQIGPVQLLNSLIRSIPGKSNMWLTLVDQKAERIQIVGYAERGDSIPDFMVNLSSSGLFKSVDLDLVQEDKEASKFSLVCISSKYLTRE